MYATVAPVLNTNIKYLFKVTNLPYMVIYLIQHYLHEIAQWLKTAVSKE